MPWTVSDFTSGSTPAKTDAFTDLDADEVERLRAPRPNPRTMPLGVGDDAVVVGPAVDDRHRDERIGVDVLLRHRAQVDVGQRVAVDDQESIGREQRDRARRAARRAENVGLPRITHVEPICGAVADDARDGVGAMMQVQDDAPDAGVAQPVQDARRRAACPRPATRPWRERSRVAAGEWPGRRSAPAPASSAARHRGAAHSPARTGEHHVVSREAVRVAMLQEEEAVRVGDVVRRRACRARAAVSWIASSPPSISTNTPTGVSSTAITTSSLENSSRYFS